MKDDTTREWQISTKKYTERGRQEAIPQKDVGMALWLLLNWNPHTPLPAIPTFLIFVCFQVITPLASMPASYIL